MGKKRLGMYRKGFVLVVVAVHPLAEIEDIPHVEESVRCG